jgi:CRP-like cAMP-binding protein
MVRLLKHGRTPRRRTQGIADVGFPAGATLFDRQHPSRRIYLLRSGWIELSSDHDVILDHLTRGDWLGEKLLLGSRRVDQLAKARTFIEATPFRKAEFYQRLHRDRRFAQQVLRSLARRMDRYEAAIRDFATEPTERRLALALAALAPTRPATGWVRLPWSPTNPELAKMVGTTRWSVSHLLNRFQRLGWLRRQEGLWVQRQDLEAFLEPSARPNSAGRR